MPNPSAAEHPVPGAATATTDREPEDPIGATPVARSDPEPTTLDRVDDDRVDDDVRGEDEIRADDLSDGELSERPEPQEQQYVVDDGVATDDGTTSTVEPRSALWVGPETEALRERWREMELRFVDDPRSAADDAARLVDEAAQTLIATIEARRAELTQSHPTDATEPDATEPDATEQLRIAVQRYREFLEQVLKL